MAICGLHIHGGLKFTIRELAIEISENDTCFFELLSKLKIKVIKFIIKFLRLFSATVQMTKISSMYLNHTRGWNLRRSKLSIYCCSWNLLIRFIRKLKVVVFNKNSAILTSLPLGTLCAFLLFNTSLSASRPAWCDILG